MASPLRDFSCFFARCVTRVLLPSLRKPLARLAIPEVTGTRVHQHRKVETGGTPAMPVMRVILEHVGSLLEIIKRVAYGPDEPSRPGLFRHTQMRACTTKVSFA
jgi:hypothetical protein